MSQRKIILTPRPARRRPVPAYQVRRSGRTSSDDAADVPPEAPATERDSKRTDTAAFEIPNFDTVAEPAADDAQPDAADDVGAHEASAEAGTVDEVSEAAEDETEDESVSAPEAVATADVIEEAPSEPTESAPADAAEGATTTIEPADEGEDYADVVRSVEEAAARERGDAAEPANTQTASVGADTAATVAAGSVNVLTPDAVRRQRAAQGDRKSVV